MTDRTPVATPAIASLAGPDTCADGRGPFAALPPDRRPREYRLVREADGLAARVWFTLGSDAPWFAGHFPDRPILPGVAQLHLAALGAERLFAGDGAARATGTRRVKFQRPIRPDEPLVLSWQADALPASRVRFTLEVDGQAASSGTLVFARLA